jgi:2,4-diketo-3-deoxy-L-fuconate hydrolase
MRLVRFGERGKEQPGVLDSEGLRRDCSDEFNDYDAHFFANGGLAALSEYVGSRQNNLKVVADHVRWGAPIRRPGKVICIGLNYRDHAEESGMELPPEPVVFFKAPNAVVGPYDEVLIPRGGTQTDWEIELAVVIGVEARYIDSREEAGRHIAGFCICNDVSERNFQLHRAGQWVKGKSCDTFCPLGPWLATQDEIPNVSNLEMTLDVNGRRMQTGNTRTMVFSVEHIIHYVSQFMTIEPGDVISTGTPPGVGLGRVPPTFLKPGDMMELYVEGLGRQRQVCGVA